MGYGFVMEPLSFFGLGCGQSASLLIGTAALIPVMGAMLFFGAPKREDDNGGRKIKEVVQ